MINKIKAWIHAHKIYDSDTPIVVIPATHQEDTNSIKSRVKRAFESQKQQMNARALIRHQCKEPDICTKIHCFEWEPDKIRKVSTVRIPKKRRTNLEMLKSD